MWTVKLKPKCTNSDATLIFWSLLTALQKSSNNWWIWAFKYMNVMLLMEKTNKKHTLVKHAGRQTKNKIWEKEQTAHIYSSHSILLQHKGWVWPTKMDSLFPLTVQDNIKWWLTENHSEGHRYKEEYGRNQIQKEVSVHIWTYNGLTSSMSFYLPKLTFPW